MTSPNAHPLRTVAPAKLNLTLEILGKREDGFHDLISVVQTLDFADDVVLAPAASGRAPVSGSSVEFRDPAGRPLPAPAAELIARTWQRLSQHCGRDLPGVVRVTKRLPIAGGLGGGSSNAAAFLRLADRFWDLRLSPGDQSHLAAQAGSDVPLFLHGGTLLIEGRGERITPLPDAGHASPDHASPDHASPDHASPDHASPDHDSPDTAWLGLLHTPELPLPAAKTATMFSALRPRHFSDGARSRALAAKLARGEPPQRDDLTNTFDTVAGEVLLGVAAVRRRFATAAHAVPLLAGAGPSLFLLGTPAFDAPMLDALATTLAARGGHARVVRPLERAAATAVTAD